MKFWEAMIEMQEFGKKIKRSDFRDGQYISIADGFVECGLLTTDFLFCCQFEWEIYEEPSKEYTFSEIIPLLKNGKKFKRKMWEKRFLFESIGYLFIRDNENGVSFQWQPKISDVQGCSWIEVKEC